METDFPNIEGMFKFNTDIVNKTIAEVSPESWFLKPGDDSNHLLWVLGHMTWARGNVLKILNQQYETPASALFERGSPKVPPDEYPTVDEMKGVWNDVSQKLAAALTRVSPEHLGQPALSLPPSYDGKVSGNIAFMAFHESYHVGQLNYLRKWLGFGQGVG